MKRLFVILLLVLFHNSSYILAEDCIVDDSKITQEDPKDTDKK